MEKKSQDFSMEDAMRLARSPAAKQLMDALRAKDPGSVDRAMDHAASGDVAQVRRDLEALLQDPSLRALLKQLGG